MHEKPMTIVIFDGFDFSFEFARSEYIEENYLPEPSYGMDPNYDPPSWPVELDPEIPF
mgnify:CR=1 FL=1